MAKGAIAKDALMERFKIALGKDYVGVDETGKKFYFWSEEDGERMQVCITMTVPKTPLNSTVGDGLDFSQDPTEKPTKTAVEVISDDEKATLDKILKELGL